MAPIYYYPRVRLSPLLRPAFVAPALLVLCLSACGQTRGRPGTVLIASGADLQSINPLLTVHPIARQVQRYVLLTTLVRYDSTLTIEPYLARTWSWSLDRTSLTLRIFGGLTWHDGHPTTARDAAWTLDAARDPVTGYPRAGDLAPLTDIAAPDDTTLVLGFATPQSGIPDVLTDLSIVPRHLLESVPRGQLRQAAWNEAPIGNGPFRFVAHDPNRRWVFARNDRFPVALGGPPRIERLVVAVVDEPLTKLAGLASGELDFAGIQPAHAEFVRRDGRLAVLDYPLLFTVGLVFNTRRPPFDDPVVRRAAGLAVDRREIVQGYLWGFGRPSAGPVPPDVPGSRDLPIPPYRPDSAAALLGGRTIPFQLLTVGSGEAALEQLLQVQMARAGFTVSIRQLELSAFLDRVYGNTPDFDAAVLGTPGDFGLGYLRTLLRLAGIHGTGDPQEIFADSVPMAVLYHARGVQGRNIRVTGVRMDLRGELPTVTRWETRP